MVFSITEKFMTCRYVSFSIPPGVQELLSSSRTTFIAQCAILVVLAATALFVLGPLAGSIDDDNDGMPDLPVVVTSSDIGTNPISRSLQCCAEIKPSRTSDRDSLAACVNPRRTDDDPRVGWAEAATQGSSNPLRC